MQERWADVKGFEGYYEVSDLGRVRSKDRVIWRNRLWHHMRGRMLTTYLCLGYARVTMSKDGQAIRRNIHRMVAQCFVEGDQTLDVNHKNGDRADARAENLEWVTASENMRHAYRVLGHSKTGGSPERPIYVRGGDWDGWRRYPNTCEAKRALGLGSISHLRRVARRGGKVRGYDLTYQEPGRVAA